MGRRGTELYDLRDIDDLAKHGILVKEPGDGRGTSYALAEGRIG